MEDAAMKSILMPIIGELNTHTVIRMCDIYHTMLNPTDFSEVVLDVIVSSEGGDSDVFCVFVDLFKYWRMKGNVNTLAVGEVMSGAPLIVAAGSKGHRLAMEHTLFGLHEPYITTIQGDPAVFESEKRNLQSTIDRFYTLLSELTDTSVRTWRSRIHGKSLLTFDAKQAKKWCLVDTVQGE